jgi:hypothetical protein
VDRPRRAYFAVWWHLHVFSGLFAMSSLVNTRRIAEILDELYVAEASCQAKLALDFGDYDIAHRLDHEVMVMVIRMRDRRQGEPDRKD